jgi:Arc/MetJ family transcription regulator
MARTNIVLDDELVSKCRKATGIGTKRGLIDHALRELLRHANRKKLLDLKGTVDWEGDLYALRQGRVS